MWCLGALVYFPCRELIGFVWKLYFDARKRRSSKLSKQIMIDGSAENTNSPSTAQSIKNRNLLMRMQIMKPKL
jgi:hypothetical protein